MIKKIVTILFLLITCNSFAATVIYYVAANGNDNNSGLSTGLPLKTGNKAILLAQPGDFILFNRGDVFYGGITINKSGSSGMPITIGTYGSGAMPIISGFTSVTSWTQISTNIWESSSGISTLPTAKVVMINGVSTPMGRYPNSGYLTYQISNGASSFTSNSLNSAVTNWTGAKVVVRKYNYVTDVCNITSQSGGTLNFNSTDGYNTQAGYGFYIENDVRTLDAQNEWYYNPSTKKIRIYSTSQPTNVQVATKDTLVTIIGIIHDITFDGIAFQGANKYIATVRSAQNIVFQNCTMTYSQDGIWGGQNGGAASTGFLVQNSAIDHINNNAMVFESEFTGAVIQNNTITNIGTNDGMGGDGSGNYGTLYGIQAYAAGILIHDNIVRNVGYNPIAFRGTGVQIYNNIVDTFCNVKQDGGGIYSYMGNSLRSYTGQKVYNNIVQHGLGAPSGTPSPILAHGIYMDDGVANVEIYGNTSANNAYSGVYLHNNYNINLHDNTLYDNGVEQILQASFEPTYPNRLINVKHNYVIAKESTQRVMSYESFQNDISSFGTIDSNYYCRPILENNTVIHVALNNYTINSDYSRAMWNGFSGFDAHTTISPINISNSSQLFDYINKTSGVVNTPIVTGVNMANTSFTGTTNLGAFSSLILIQTASLITPTITWSNQTVVYGSSLSSTQTATSGGVAGHFTYNISGTPNAGTYANYTATFIPDDQSTYAITSKTVTLTITPQPITGTVSNTTVTYNGFAQLPVLTTSPVAGITYSILLNGVSGGQVHAGSWTYTIGLNNSNYSMTPLIGTFTINPQTITVSVGNTSQTYDSTLRNVTVTTIPAGIATSNSLTDKRYSGTYSGTITSANSDYTFTPVNYTLTINKGTFVYTWNPATPITYPTPIGASQLDASGVKSASYVYQPATGTVLSAGLQTLKLNIIPADTNLSQILNITQQITVNKGTQTITVGSTTQYFDGTVKVISASVPSNTGTLTTVYTGGHTAAGDYPFTTSYSDPNWQASPISGTLHILSNAANIYMTNYQNLVYDGTAKVPTVNSAYPYTLAYSPSNHTDVGDVQVIATISDGGVHVGADTVTMTIIKANPTYSWPTITGGTYPYIITSGILNASSPVPISWTYNIAVGDTLSVGTFGIIATGTPTDLVNYNIISVTQNVTVTNGVATISASGFNQVYDSLPKPITASTTPPNLPLIITYNGSQTPPSLAASYSVSVNLASGSNYVATPVTGTLVISKGSSILSWAQPQPIQQGSALSTAQLSMTSDRDGIITYNFPIGYIFRNAGAYTLTGTFTPTNPNYNIQTKSVQITVYGNPSLDIFILHGKPFPVQEPINIPLF